MLKPDFKQKLKEGKVLFGTFYKLNCPALVEMMGYAGFDFIIVDNEHANFTYTEMENIIRAADGVDLHTIIRIPSAAEEHIAHALDSGASGIQIPGLTTVEQAKAAMPHTKYYPGRRGMNFTQRAANYGYMDKDAYFKSANEDTLVVVHVENKEMVDQVEALCQVPEIDVLFAGPGDLSQSVGKPGQANAPEVVALVERIFATAAKYNKAVGIWVGSEADAAKYIEMGAQYIGYMNDIALVNSVLQNTAKVFDKFRAPK